MAGLNRSLPGADYERRILEKVSRSFALTIPQLPSQLCRPVANAYLLCRIVDTIEDEAGISIDQKDHFLHEFVDVVQGSSPPEKFADGLAPLLTERTLPAERDLIRNTPTVMNTFFSLNDRQRAEIRKCVETMAIGMLDFQKIQNPMGLETMDQMDRYCYYVAGVVGDMLTGLFCDYSEDIARNQTKLISLASSFGQGLQMTNIIKDLWEDKARGACWFPKDVFLEAGFDLETLSADNYDPAFREGLAKLIGVAHWHLSNAVDYTLLIPKEETGIRKFCIWAIGMAVFTLKNINKTRDYTCGQDIKISRRRTRNIIMVSNAAIKNDNLIRFLFKFAGRGLCMPISDNHISKPLVIPITETLPRERRRSMN
ncbi:Squalene synthase (EC [Olavius algarvensis associated proteobacterium Delta 3]|nr:Squalene synthase (EC [Olavius algarvensis associated proteobacterium Delta 3]